MKRLFLLLFIIINVSVNAQKVWEWNDSIDVSKCVASDTIIQPKPWQMPPIAIGSFCWSVTFDAETLNDDDSQIEIGGSNMTLNPLGTYVKSRYYKYNSFQSDAFPVTLNKITLQQIIRNGIVDTIYTTSVVGDAFYFDFPMIKFSKGSVSSGYLKWYFKAYK